MMSGPAQPRAAAEAACRAVPLDHVRNIGIMAHINAGKTTLTERILFCTGVISCLGEVHEGTATTDWMPQERERGISITSAATVCPWKGYQIDIIDTPGHIDFTAEVERSLRVLDGAVAVFCGTRGVQPQSETVWRQARRYGVPVVAFVNKLDRPGASVERVLEGIREKLRITPLALQLPIGADAAFQGVVDLVEFRALLFDEGPFPRVEPVPGALLERARSARALLIECLAETDEVLMERFLADEDPTAAEIRAALRRATLAGQVMPVVCGSALANRGVTALLDAVVQYLPSPLDVRQVAGVEPESGRPAARVVGDAEPFAALAFKTLGDRSSERLTLLRVYSGTARPGMRVRNARTGAEEQIRGVMRVQANMAEERPEVFCGDIAAVTGLSEDTQTGDTLCAPDAPIAFSSMRFPEPVVSVAVEPRSAADRERLHQALRDLAHEDPTFRVRTDSETGQTLLAGMGELHLDIIRDRLERDFQVPVRIGRPCVTYRQTVSRQAYGEVTFVRQTGPSRQYAAVRLEVVPRPQGQGLSVSFEAPEDRVPTLFHNAVEAGIREMAAGGLDGARPLTDCQVRVVDGAYDPADSSDLAFRAAAGMALRDAVRKAGVHVLEPVMTVEVLTPPEFLGDVIADLASRHGRVTEVDTLACGTARVDARVPLAELFGYATVLRSLTRGRAEFTAEPSHYEPVRAQAGERSREV